MARRIRLLVAAALVAASAVVVAGSAWIGVVVAGPERCC